LGTPLMVLTNQDSVEFLFLRAYVLETLLLDRRILIS
jgi:hypothetical protein